MQIFEFQPDWCKRLTATEAEEQLTNFRFLGPGWYVTQTDTLLVVPDADVKYPYPPGDAKEGPWHNLWHRDQKFWFFVYSGRTPFEAFNALVNAPTRRDER